MKTFLKSAQQHGELRLFDRQFARHLTELNGAEVPELLLASALTSYGISRGDTCLVLDTVAKSSLYTNPDLRVVRQKVPPVEKWRKVLLKQKVVTTPPEASQTDVGSEESETDSAGSSDPPIAPLILDSDNRLYLARYWSLEQSLVASVNRLLERDVPEIDKTKLGGVLSALFDSTEEPDWQKAAVANSVLSNLSVITGGPGTGKTYTVTALLAALLDQGVEARKIALAAPTGKASTRLTQSIRNNLSGLLQKLNLPEASFESVTLHKLIGMRPGRVRPMHNKDAPLLHDVVIIDEASMIDLPLMARTFEALSDNARIVLIGDKDQLHSVESGMVLGDICGGRSRAELSQKRCEELTGIGVGGTPPCAKPGGKIADHIIYLDKSHRVLDDGGISALANAVNEGNVESAFDLLASEKRPGLVLMPQIPTSLDSVLRDHVLPACREYIAADSPAEALLKMTDTGVLCALRHGPSGALKINSLVEKLLADEGLCDANAQYYHGQPIMVTENSNPQRLYNGDHGLVLADDNGSFAVHFATEGTTTEARAISPNRLPKHENFYAMTIHKSQGSEYSTVVVVLPETDSPILNRELLYTAITRARSRVIVIANEAQLRTCIEKRSVRQSGLRDKFWHELALDELAAETLLTDSDSTAETVADKKPAAEVKKPKTEETDRESANKGKPSLPVQTTLDF